MSIFYRKQNGVIILAEQNGVIITQSLPIIEFLEETFKESTRILPEDPFSRAKVDSLH